MDAYYTGPDGKREKLHATPPSPLTDDSSAGAELQIRPDHLEVRAGFRRGPFRSGRRGLPE